MDKRINTWCSIHTDELIETLIELDYDDIIQFIKDLDIRMADFCFTEDLYKYFKECVDHFINYQITDTHD